jgi:hypothetical protein
VSYRYPRAGSQGDPRLAAEVHGLLEEAASVGIPLWKLGPSLVLGFARFFRRLPSKIQRGADKTQVPLLYLLLGSGTPPLKMSQPDSAYQTRSVGKQRCSNCSSAYTQVVTGKMICSQVEGTIQGDHWCRLWNMDRD